MKTKEVKRESEWFYFIYLDEFCEGLKNVDYFVRVSSYRILWNGNQNSAWTPAEIDWRQGKTGNTETMEDFQISIIKANFKAKMMNREHGLCNI